MPDVDPTPRGTCRIGSPHNSNHTGCHTMNLDPLPGTNTFDQTLLRVHGDSTRHAGQASDGCIVLLHAARQSIRASGDHVIQVAP